MPGSQRGPRLHGAAVAVLTTAALVALVALVPGLLPGQVRNLVGLGPEPLGTPPAVTGTGSFRFLAHQRGAPDQPVAYDPCRPIQVELNPEGGPPNARDLVVRAMARLHEATGLRFELVGVSDRRPLWRSETVPQLASEQAPVLVSWASEDEVPQLAGHVAGLGGSTRVGGRTGDARYVTGQVTFDIDAFSTLAARPNGDREAQAIVYHEFGHLVGLDHVEDPQELMYAENVGQLDFGPGDLAGLARLGEGRCF